MDSERELREMLESGIVTPMDKEIFRLMHEHYPRRPDAMNGIAPLYHGWIIREAFMRGVLWERQQRQEQEEDRG